MGSDLALLLSYPDDDVLRLRGSVDAPHGLEAFCAWWRDAPALELQQAYVDTFDGNPAAALYLTYHRYGDRRERGRALIGVQRRFREAGWHPPAGETPDSLPAVLELVEVAPAAGLAVLEEYAPEVDAIHAALAAAGSPWADVLEAVAELVPQGVAA